MIGCWSFNAYADDTIQHAAKEFASAIQNPKELQDLIGDDGLIVIRNFVTGGFGTRGRDIRYSLQKRDVPLDGSFPVKGEIPVLLSLLFAESAKKGLDAEFLTVQAKCQSVFLQQEIEKMQPVSDYERRYQLHCRGYQRYKARNGFNRPPLLR